MMNYPPYKFLIGIDSGVQTGFALYFKPQRKLWFVQTMMVHRAMWLVYRYHRSAPGQLLVRVEDARQAVHGRQADQYRAMGAGSVMRDAKLWEDFLTDMGTPFEMLRPRKQFTKMPADKFRQLTGFTGKTNEHARDAAMLVFGY